MRLLFAVLLLAYQANAQCPISELKIQNLDESGVRQFVNQYAQAGLPLEQFACCLPEVFRHQYVVAHSSFAGQDSIPQSPRVIMTNLSQRPNGQIQLPSAFFSINGGHSSLRQTKSVEVALVSPKTGKVDFYDIDFLSGRAHMGPANPPQCIGCHGTRGQYGKTGPHLIFDGPIIWPKFVNGIQLLSRLENHPTAPEVQNYFFRLQNESSKALTQNSRFKCISSEIPNVNFLNTLDLAIGKLNSIKVSSEIVKSLDYHRFKYALFGAELCPSMLQDLDCQIQSIQHSPFKKCNQWIHPKRIQSLNQVSSIFKSIKDLNHIGDIDSIARQAFLNRRNEIYQTIQSSNQNNEIQKVSFEFRRGFVDEKQHILPQNLKGIQSVILRKYAIDGELRGSQLNLLTRFLFESRGITVSNWSTDVVAGYQRSGIDLKELLKYESFSSPLRLSLKKNDPKTCLALRDLSWDATQ